MLKNSIIALLVLVNLALFLQLPAGTLSRPPSSADHEGRTGARKSARSPADGGNHTRLPGEPLPQYVEDDGSISGYAISDFGLTREQVDRLKAITDSYRAEMTATCAENLFLDEVATRAERNGRQIYRLPALSPEERGRILDSIEQQFREVTDDDTAEALLNSITRNKAFGYMGEYDAVFRIEKNPGDGSTPAGDRYLIRCSYSNPRSGNTGSRFTRGSEEMKQYFGNILPH